MTCEKKEKKAHPDESFL